MKHFGGVGRGTKEQASPSTGRVGRLRAGAERSSDPICFARLQPPPDLKVNRSIVRIGGHNEPKRDLRQSRLYFHAFRTVRPHHASYSRCAINRPNFRLGETRIVALITAQPEVTTRLVKFSPVIRIPGRRDHAKRFCDVCRADSVTRLARFANSRKSRLNAMKASP
jgi:hypothetical protein